MDNDDLILSDIEIEYLDRLLLDISHMGTPRSISSYKKPWIDLEKIQSTDSITALELLRIKGIVGIENITKFIDTNEDRIEKVSVEVGYFDIKELIKCWLLTVFYRSGKTFSVNEIANLEENSGVYSYPIKIGSDFVHIKFVTQDIEEFHDSQGTLYVSFIGLLPLNEKNYIHWYSPLSELSAAARFFTWIHEQSKPILSKQYSFINVPSDLDKSQRESMFMLIKKYFISIGLKRYNQPEYFIPESTDYFFPEGSIRECFIDEQLSKKIFIVFNETRIQFHTFLNGTKTSDNEISFHVEKLESWIEKKADFLRRNTDKTKTSLVSELIKIVPIIGAIFLSVLTSYKLLFTNNTVLKSLPTTPFWIISHITLGIFSIIVLFLIGLWPHFRKWCFSWDRFITRFAKKNKSKYSEISTS